MCLHSTYQLLHTKTFHQSDTCRLNPKHMSTSYLKSESQIIWARKAARSKSVADEAPHEVGLYTQLSQNLTCEYANRVWTCSLRGDAALTSSLSTRAHAICAWGALRTSHP